MQNIIRLLFVPLIAVAFAAASFAQTAPQTPAKPAEKKKESAPKSLRAGGELVAADTKAGTLKVKTKDNKELSLIAETKETKDALAKVKVGDAVKVAYVEKDGKLSLRSVAKNTTKPKPKGTTTGKQAETKPAE